MAFGFGKKEKDQVEGEISSAEVSESAPVGDNKGAEKEESQKPKPSTGAKLAGEKRYFIEDLSPFLPTEMVAGMLPYVPGTEDEAVWNAASQACATEKVHYVYSIEGERIWYLACPSTAIASSPDSWCPLAAALPGNSEFWDKETVYIYEKDGAAAALRWDQETGRMQIFLGAARTILPRIQSMDANFITINDKVATIVPWKNRQLRTEQLSRATARMLLISGIVTSLVLMVFLAAQYIMINFLDRNLEKVRMDSDAASMKLLTQAADLSKNDILRHTARIQQLLDDLSKVDGTLVRYEVDKKGVLEWEVLVPAAYSTGVMSIRGQAQPGIEKDGRVRVKGKN